MKENAELNIVIPAWGFPGTGKEASYGSGEGKEEARGRLEVDPREFDGPGKWQTATGRED